MNIKFKTGSELRRTQNAQTIFSKSLGGNRTQNALLDISTSFVRIDQLAGEWILKNRVNSEVAASCCL